MNKFSSAHIISLNKYQTSQNPRIQQLSVSSESQKSQLQNLLLFQFRNVKQELPENKPRQMSLHLPDSVPTYSLGKGLKTPRDSNQGHLTMNRKWSTFPTQGTLFVFLRFCPCQVNPKNVKNEHMKFPINFRKKSSEHCDFLAVPLQLHIPLSIYLVAGR